MKILLANSNTSPEVTGMILAEAERFASPGTTVTGRAARFGARVVGSRTKAAVSTHALLDRLAEEASGHGAVVIGMSLDAGLWAARELSTQDGTPRPALTRCRQRVARRRSSRKLRRSARPTSASGDTASTPARATRSWSGNSIDWRDP